MAGKISALHLLKRKSQRRRTGERLPEILGFLHKYPIGRILLDLSQRDKLEIVGGTQHIFGGIFKGALKVIKRPLFLALVLTRKAYYLTIEASLFDQMLEADNDYVINPPVCGCR